MLRKELPKMYELFDQIKNSSSSNAFSHVLDDFEENKSQELWILEEKKRELLKKEKQLQELDSDSWEFLKKEAFPYLTKKDELRGWTQLFDFLNQVLAFNYLHSIGCSSINFIPRSSTKKTKTPDLKGFLGSIKVLCEVKTINESKEELQTRREMIVKTVEVKLDHRFFNKLMLDITKAREQLEAYDTAKKTKRIVYIIIDFDDWTGEDKKAHYQQIDEYLLNNPISGIDIVFHNKKTVFHKTIFMKSASVVNE